jgi:hypothetical protein
VKEKPQRAPKGKKPAAKTDDDKADDKADEKAE